MKNVQLVVLFSAFLSLISISFACDGCLNLDQYNFQKVIKKFKAVMVKFDVAYPYGEKHDTFSQVSKELLDVEDVIFGLVGIKDYGDKHNVELAKKYGVETKDELPTLRLFLDGSDEPIGFPQDEDWSAQNLKKLIRDNSGIYIGLPGCIETFDRLAIDFVRNGDRQGNLYKAEELKNELKTEREKTIANIYIKYMKKVIDKDVDFIIPEEERLNKLLKDKKINQKQKDNILNRINILKSFKLRKEEL